MTVVSILDIDRAFSPLLCGLIIPGASPQTDIGRALGALQFLILSVKEPASFRLGGNPREGMDGVFGALQSTVKA